MEGSYETGHASSLNDKWISTKFIVTFTKNAWFVWKHLGKHFQNIQTS